MPRSIRLALASALLIAVAAPALSDDKRLDAKHLAAAPTANVGTGVADLETWVAPANPAATYRNMEEIVPTRRIASGQWVSPLNAPTAPFDVHYTIEGEAHHLRLGLRYVRGLRAESGMAIAAAKPFRDVDELARRVPELRKNELEMLAGTGALAKLGTAHRRDALWKAGRAGRPDGPPSM